jgi:hypothetical protein
MSLASKPLYALSIKQPWATLVVAGLKSVEVRRWPTSRRGQVLIHAARVPDPRELGWKLVPPELSESAQLAGGIVGMAELTECLAYHDLESFNADQAKHRNDPTWFLEPVLYGFQFANPVSLAFRPYPGWMRFFPVLAEPPSGRAALNR